MATNNSINNTSNPLSTTELAVDPGASGDSYIQFDINAVAKFRLGVDDTASDAFKLSNGSALGTNDYWAIESTGECTYPNNSYFLTRVSSEANVTGDGTAHKMGSVTADIIQINIGSDYAVGNGAGTGGTYTAPVTGFYIFNQSVFLNVLSGGTTMTMSFVTSNRTYRYLNLPTLAKITGFTGGNNRLAHIGTTFADMDASDTLQFQLTAYGAGKTNDTVGAATITCKGTLLY